MWGHLSLDVMGDLLKVIEEEGETLQCSALLLDLRGVTSADAEVVEALHDRWRGTTQRFLNGASLLAAAKPTGVAGAVAIALVGLLAHERPIGRFDSVPDALTWLVGAPAAAVLTALLGQHTELAQAASCLTRIRAELIRDPVAPIEVVAKRLGTSVRTLQRRLRGSATTFAEEAQRARLARAMHRMRQPNVTLTSLALELGFSSVQSFGRWFRQQAGATPTRWRSESTQDPMGTVSSALLRPRALEAEPYQLCYASK